eukprot:gnl/TRDRNA2_/TRDRNA2_179597_c0_seq1.p1 gnl/TRDRNA2_/TRDRNA2_179597_c0~~gnl/TRDRNA2_/TRDRNA2_179597_c0_seq1.p1  ORF type:complete len:168 (+),score=23.93 gnl/TRDRNA2_/TRDRNA2_179597_c0_seq1:162-665(+)
MGLVARTWLCIGLLACGASGTSLKTGGLPSPTPVAHTSLLQRHQEARRLSLRHEELQHHHVALDSSQQRPDVFLQQQRQRERRRHSYRRNPFDFRFRDPKDIEAQEDLFWGVPKLVWVILLDILAFAVFLGCVPCILYMAKRRRPDFDAAGDGGGSCWSKTFGGPGG